MPPLPPQLIIVSGLSGSGKSTALQSLEDSGYYCIDNLPAVLLVDLGAYLNTPQGRAIANFRHGIAVSVDARNKDFLRQIEGVLAKLDKKRIPYRLLFLEADEQVLIRRYSETRRRHPLTNLKTPLREGIGQERTLLEPLRQRAEKILDTSDYTSHELRREVRDFSTSSQDSAPLFFIESFGFKFGLPQDADFVFDVRCLPNPYWEESLRQYTGLDPQVAEFLGGQRSVAEMVRQIYDFVSAWLPEFSEDSRSYLTVAIGCTGGQHRSVYVAEQLKQRFTEVDTEIQVRHRELKNET